MAEQRGIHVSQLGRFFESYEFRSRIKRLATYTLTQRLEGGFAAYRNPRARKLVLSSLVAPSREELQAAAAEAAEQSVCSPRELIDTRNGDGINVSLRSVIGDASTHSRLRRDIGFIIHSHTGDVRAPWPSPNDLKRSQEVALVNPGLIEAVLTADKTTDSITMLAYRPSDQGVCQPGYIHALEDDSPLSAIRNAMENAGLNSVQLGYTLKGIPRPVFTTTTVAELYK